MRTSSHIKIVKPLHESPTDTAGGLGGGSGSTSSEGGRGGGGDDLSSRVLVLEMELKSIKDILIRLEPTINATYQNMISKEYLKDHYPTTLKMYIALASLMFVGVGIICTIYIWLTPIYLKSIINDKPIHQEGGLKNQELE